MLLIAAVLNIVQGVRFTCLQVPVPVLAVL